MSADPPLMAGTIRERATALAGWLAEEGVVELTVNGRELRARETDLVGEIERAVQKNGRAVVTARSRTFEFVA